jgi:hypothetical protein
MREGIRGGGEKQDDFRPLSSVSDVWLELIRPQPCISRQKQSTAGQEDDEIGHFSEVQQRARFIFMPLKTFIFICRRSDLMITRIREIPLHRGRSKVDSNLAASFLMETF